MYKKVISLLSTVFALAFTLAGLCTVLYAQNPIVFQKTYGGMLYDNGYEMILTPENTFVIGGTTQSNTDIGLGNHNNEGVEDFVIFKVSSNGRMMWRTVIGGTGREDFGKMKATPDGGYIIIGTTNSNDSDITENAGQMDMVLVKVDGLGRLQWTHCYGGTGNDKGYAVYPYPDGSGYLIGGEIGSRTGKFEESRGGLDCYIARLDKEGEIIWQKILGGSNNERVADIMGLSGGRTLFLASTMSADRDVKNVIGKKDAWVVSLSKNNDIVWQKCYGGTEFDELHSMQLNAKGNLMMVGTTFSANRDIPKQNGFGDIWAVEISPADGKLIWSNSYGGARSDGASSITPLPDGGYVISGSSTSENGFVTKCKGHYDGVVMKIDSSGNNLWTLMLGGKEYEAIYRTLPLPTGDYMAVGYAESTDGDLMPMRKTLGNDVWFMKISFTGGKDFESLNYITGFTHNAITNKPVKAAITITNNSSLRKISIDSSQSKTGLYQMEIPAGENLSINITAPGYMFYGQDIPLAELEISPELRIDAPLQPIKVGSKVILNNIFFPTASYEIQPESKPELIRLEEFLKLNPTVDIEIGGHTDNTGNLSDKKELSARRAKAVRDHLLKVGVSGYRMTVVGYGMDQPLEGNDTEEGRQKNRRVEVKITAI